MQDDIYERTASLEAGHKALHNDLSAIATGLEGLGKDFRQSMDRLQEKIASQSATPWGVLASWASVIILILTIVGSFYVRDLSRIQGDVERIPKEIEKEQVLREEIHSLKMQNLEQKIEILGSRKGV